MGANSTENDMFKAKYLYPLSNSCGSKSLSVLAQNYMNIFWIITIIRITPQYLDGPMWRHYF